MNDQPSEAQELANAAYVWRRHVQADLVEAMRDTSIKLEKAQFWFTRFINAYNREIEANKVAREPKAAKAAN